MITGINQRHRCSIRIPGYHYGEQGAYFITLCTHNRESLFGTIVNGEMILNDIGHVVKNCWLDIPNHFGHVELDEYVMMPNHIHGVVVIVGARHVVPLQDAISQPNTISEPDAIPLRAEQFGRPVSGSIPTIIRSFKSAVTKQIHKLCPAAGQSVWQRNYWEHIVRDESEMNRIREYIQQNPAKWELDELYRL